MTKRSVEWIVAVQALGGRRSTLVDLEANYVAGGVVTRKESGVIALWELNIN